MAHRRINRARIYSVLSIGGAVMLSACSSEESPTGGDESPIDANQDGVADDLGVKVVDDFDINGDGVGDGPGIDTDGDGTPDGVGIDSDGDGIIESIDIDGDGVVDIVMNPDGVGGGTSTGGSGNGGFGSGAGGQASGGTGTGGADLGTGGTMGSGGTASDAPYCEPTMGWEATWTQLEQDILDIVNQERAQGANCGGEEMPPVDALTMDPYLQCAARMHSRDMAMRDYFDHDNLEGEGPGERMDKAGYEGNGWGENIAAGSGTAAGTMDQWMNSAGHCRNLMSGSFSLIGVGYYPGGEFGHMWTQTFGN